MTVRPKLILLNGPPAVGKTSLARRYAEDHPLTLHLDVDEIRSMISGWATDTQGSGLRARAMVEVMAESYLASGGDVIVSQLYGRVDGLISLEQVARSTEAAWIEIVLIAPAKMIEQRFLERAGPQLEAIASTDRSIADQLAEFEARIATVIPQRTDCVVIDASTAPNVTYQAVLATIDLAANR